MCFLNKKVICRQTSTERNSVTTHFELEVMATDLDPFKKISDVLDTLPTPYLGFTPNGSHIVLSCHILARAVGAVFGLPVIDGMYAVAYKHSWLRIPQSRNIIDVYPVAMLGGPLLISGISGPGRTLYVEKDISCFHRDGLNFHEPAFIKAVEIMIKDIEFAHHWVSVVSVPAE